MTYQVLARKWRPRDFDALVGQEHVVKALRHGLERQRLHHAYLFSGTRGIGKTTIARILAKSLNCETGITAKPCGQCSACVEIDAGRFVDLLEVDAATNTKVEEMRQLLENAVYTPTRGRFKVYVIDEVHMLSNWAFNAMLKTLEEPPEHVKFILATTEPQKIPVTVLSRCLQFNLKQMPASLIAEHLERIVAEEEVAGDPGALRLIAASARGSMRDALSLLDQAIAYCAGNLTEEHLRAMLGTIDEEFLIELLEALARGDARGALEVVDRMQARNVSFDGALQDLAALLHRVALAQVAPEALPEGDPRGAAAASLAAKLSPEDVQLYYQIALHGRDDLPLAPDEYAGFAMSLLRMFAFRADTGEPAAGAMAAKRDGTAARRAEAGTSAAGAFDGDWPALVRALSVTGMARQLAQQSELKSFDGEAMELCVAQSARHLADRICQDRLRSALQEYFRRPIRLKVSVGATNGNTAQDQAVASIQQDEFVREMLENFDATIVSSSIKPAS